MGRLSSRVSGNRRTSCISKKKLWTVLCHTEGAVKEIFHNLETETLPRCLKASPRLCQRITISGLILVTSIPISAALTIQTCPHKTLSPSPIKVIAFDPDDKVMQYDADASPHDDDHVALDVDQLDPDLF